MTKINIDTLNEIVRVGDDYHLLDSELSVLAYIPCNDFELIIVRLSGYPVVLCPPTFQWHDLPERFCERYKHDVSIWQDTLIRRDKFLLQPLTEEQLDRLVYEIYLLAPLDPDVFKAARRVIFGE